ncbi:MAG: transglutaminase family protein [Niabella sp.]
MDNDKEVAALLTLIEDPDTEVFEAVSDRIIAYGSPIIPDLEDLWEQTIDNAVQERIELLIHRLHFTNLKTDFTAWRDAPHHELLPGALLVAKFLYPDLHTGKVIQDIERLRRNIWIELNNYLTPLEQTNTINSILYNYFGLKGAPAADLRPNDFLISNIIEAKKGNQTGNGVLYLLLMELLDVPIKLIDLPNQFVLAYFKSRAEADSTKLHLNIDFFIDPTAGQVFTHNDLYNYFNRISSPVKPEYFNPQDNKQVIAKLLTDLSKCYDAGNKAYIQTEIEILLEILRS